MRSEQVYLKPMDRLFRHGTITGLDEADLLERFTAQRDESALEALIERHGPMVMGVCRRRLIDPHDVDDAFQATFLILIRKARGLRDQHRLGPWLHGVAYRVAARARADAFRRRDLERSGPAPNPTAWPSPGPSRIPGRALSHHRPGDRAPARVPPRGNRGLRPARSNPERCGTRARVERRGLEGQAGTRSPEAS